MAATMNRQKLITLVIEQAQGMDAAPKDLPLFEQLVYGICREDATVAQANLAFELLKDRFFDWNEIRVSTAREVGSCFEGLSDPRGRAVRLISFFQEVFESNFSFDLDLVAKKGLKPAQKQLTRYKAVNDFLIAWVSQRTLEGHCLPLDGSMRRCGSRIGLIEAECAKDPEEARTALEQVVAQAKGMEFTDGLQSVAVDFCHEEGPKCDTCPVKKLCPEAGKIAAAPVKAAKPKAPRKPR